MKNVFNIVWVSSFAVPFVFVVSGVWAAGEDGAVQSGLGNVTPWVSGALAFLAGAVLVRIVMGRRLNACTLEVAEAAPQVNRILRGQQSVLEAMAKGATKDETLTALIQFVEEITPGSIGSVLLKRGKKLFNGGENRLNPKYNAAVNGLPIGDETGSCGTAAYRGERVVVEDITTHPYWAPFQELAAMAGVKACWSQPILTETGEVLGTFAMYHEIPLSPSDDDLGLLERAAHLASIAILSEARNSDLADKTLRLEESNRDLEQFAYVASHDLQEPLRMISSYLALIRKRYEPNFDEEGTEFLDYAVTGAQRLSRMITDLLEFSRVHSQGKELEDIDLDAVVSQALAPLKAKILETEAVVKVAPDLPLVKGDQAQLALLLQNLIGNALTYRNEDRAVMVNIDAELHEGHWAVSVADNGIGIDPRYFDKIFEIFQRLNRREVYEGTGIGLSICKRIVERHGGYIWVESSPDEGAKFSFTLKQA